MLIDGNQGDRLWLAQLVSRAGPSASYQSIGRLFRAPAFTVVPGQMSMLRGAFEEVAQDRSLNLTWMRSEFYAQLAAIHPSATATGGPGFTISVYPRDDVYSYVYPTLARVDDDGAMTDRGLSLTYANPYPASWSVSVGGCLFVTGYLPYPSVSEHMFQYGYICGYLPEAQAQNGVVRPALSPPRDLKVNGMSAPDALSGVGTTPVVSWSPPAVGQPSSCTVFVRARHSVDGNVDYTTTSISVPDGSTSVRIPPNLLQPSGFAYSFRVGCHSDRGDATAFTGVVMP
jgi:hypothetical protein